VPDQQGKLSIQEKEAIGRWLAERGAGSHPCPVCGNDGWSILDQLVVAPTMQGTGFPAVLLTCSRCSFFRMHSAVLMGLA
jgi:hypothetical protein